MKPELITAIKERLAIGYELDAIRTELRSAGYDEQTIEAAVAAAQSEQPVPDTPIPPAGDTRVTDDLPSVFKLLSKGISFIRARWDLLLLLVVPLVVMAINDFLFAEFALGNTTVLAGTVIVSISVFIFYIVALAAVLHIVHQGDERAVSIREGLVWGRQNALGLVWVWILTTLVVWGGFSLLIIPGIIVSAYVILSQYVYTAEGVRGINALLRSRALVLGNWWAVAILFFIIGILFLLALFVFLLVTVLPLVLLAVLSGFSILAVGELTIGLLLQLCSVAIMIIGLHVGFSVYRVLAARRPLDVSVAPAAKGRYVVLAVFGLLIPIVVTVFVAVILASLSNAREMGMQASVMQELSVMRMSAELYASERDFSYEGFCDTVSSVSYGTVEECVDAADNWVLVVSAGDGEQYCIDAGSAPAPGRMNATETACEFAPDPKQRAGELRQTD